jgi:small conductance mechanosensitive channel
VIGRAILASLASLALIAGVASGAWIALASWIDDALSADTGKGEPNARRLTLLALFRNALAVVIITLTAMIVLSRLGINIGPLLAGAGVLGLALGYDVDAVVLDEARWGEPAGHALFDPIDFLGLIG